MKESRKSLGAILQPYLFVLKEGKKINENYLDYSLLLLQVAQGEIIPSPSNRNKTSNPINHLLKNLK